MLCATLVVSATKISRSRRLYPVETRKIPTMSATAVCEHKQMLSAVMESWPKVEVASVVLIRAATESSHGVGGTNFTFRDLNFS